MDRHEMEVHKNKKKRKGGRERRRGGEGWGEIERDLFRAILTKQKLIYSSYGNAKSVQFWN